MPLTDAQKALRNGKLTASRVACLMTGDSEKMLRLYREMIGEQEPEDLSNVWAVQLGETTEALNLRWFEKKNYPVTRIGEFVTHPWFDEFGATIDAWCEELHCPVEAKHVGGREPLEVVIDRYQPQLQWQMEVTEATQVALSVIIGAAEPTIEFIERDQAYIKELLQRARQFMQCVVTRTPPVVLAPVSAPIVADKSYDMTGNNQWGNAAAIWIENTAAAGLCKDAEKVLKSMVPADALKCFGYGIRVTRDRAGRLSLREDNQ
jgi:hypothetical protein